MGQGWLCLGGKGCGLGITHAGAQSPGLLVSTCQKNGIEVESVCCMYSKQTIWQVTIIWSKVGCV